MCHGTSLKCVIQGWNVAFVETWGQSSDQFNWIITFVNVCWLQVWQFFGDMIKSRNFFSVFNSLQLYMDVHQPDVLKLMMFYHRKIFAHRNNFSKSFFKQVLIFQLLYSEYWWSSCNYTYMCWTFPISAPWRSVTIHGAAKPKNPWAIALQMVAFSCV